MSKLRSLIAFFFLLCVASSFGQTDDPPSGIGLRLNGANYLWPVTDQLQADEFKFALEVEYAGRLTGPLYLAFPLKIGSALFPTDEQGDFEEGGRISLDGLLHLRLAGSDRFFVPYLLAGAGAVLEKAETLHFEAPVGAGFNIRLAPGTYLSLKGEYRVGLADFRHNLQIGAGLFFQLNRKVAAAALATDTDGDGLPDAQDLCPQEAGPAQLNGCPDRDLDGIADGNDACPDAPGLAALDGCPDADGDGLRDQEDACPTEPGPKSNRGCPLTSAGADMDGDGVPDAEDECPSLAGYPALNGCPDLDRDGVPDMRDRCPTEPGLIRVDGCPDQDDDGVIDSEDRCPDSPGPAENSGCPELTDEEKEVLTFASRAVQFETGADRLTQESYEVLDQIFDIMVRYPYYNLRISGHTDSVGSSRTNQTLSEKRAKTCYDYFTSQGISANRLAFIGYGESAPIADNRYEPGRTLNRRVVFELYLRD